MTFTLHLFVRRIGLAVAISAIGALGLSADAAAQSAGIEVSATSVVFGSNQDQVFYRVRLASSPSASVSVTAEAENAREATIMGADENRRLTLTFSASNWQDWQTVLLNRVGTEPSNQTTTISHTASSTDSAYNELTGPDVTVSHSSSPVTPADPLEFEDDDARDGALSVVIANEKTTGTYRVRLAESPGGAGNRVTVTPRPETGISVSPSTLTFNGGASGNWNTYQTVTITPGPADSDTSDDSYFIAHDISGIPLVARGRVMSVVVLDTITAALEFDPSAVTVVENTPGSYNLRLLTPPTSNVTVTGTISDTDVVTTRVSGASSATFTRTFTSGNWNQWQSVALHREADGTTSIAHSTTSQDNHYSGLSGDVAVTATYDPEPHATLEVSSTDVDEGDDLTVTVKLVDGDAPSTAKVFPIVYTNGTAEAADYTSVASITVAANMRTASATVPIVDDNVYEAGDETFTVALGTLPAGVRPAKADQSSSHEISIAESDKPTMSISTVKAEYLEREFVDLIFTGSNPLEARVMVNYSLSQEGMHVDFVGDLGEPSDASFSALLLVSGRVIEEVGFVNENADDLDGSATFTLLDGDDYTIGDPSSVTFFIRDTNPTTVALSAPAGDIAETSGSKVITVTLGRGLVDGESLSLPLDIGGTATFGTDYTLAAPNTLPTGVTYSNLSSTDLLTSPPTITFAGGDMASAASATLTLSATGDGFSETNETITIDLPTLDGDSGTGLSGGASGSGMVSFAITDDDDSPVVSISGPSDDLTEGDTAAYTISVAGVSATDLEIGFTVSQTGSFVDSSALGGKTLTLSPGVATLSHSVATVDDVNDEVDGSLTVTLTAGSGYTVHSTANTVALDVADDDATSVTLSAPAGDIAETSGSKVITVTLGRGLVDGESLSLPLDIGGTAAFGTDYTLEGPETDPTGVTYANLASTNVSTSPPSITFTGGEMASATSATLTVSATSDTLDETNETITIDLPELDEDSGTGLSGGASDSGTVSFAITDDDATPVVSLARTGAGAITEGASVSFTLSAPNPSAKDLSIGLSVTQTGTFVAAAGLGSKTLTLDAGETSVSYTVASDADQADEVAGSFTVTLSTPAADAGYTLGSSTTVTVTVNDDDPTPVTLTVPSAAIAENAGTKTITVTLGRALIAGESLPVVVRFAGKAAFGTDYALSAPDPAPTGVTYGTLGASTTITFTGVASSSTTATLTLTATQDPLNEGTSESVSVSLGPLNTSSGTGLQGGASGSGSGTFQITDDDAGAEVSISAGAAVVEGTAAMFTVTSTVASEMATTVNLSVAAPSAIVAAAETGTKSVVIAAGKTTATYSVATDGDTNDEVGGSVTVNIQPGTGYSISSSMGSATVAVSDDDPTSVTLAATDTTASEGSATETAAFTVTLGRALVSGETLAVPIAVAGIAAAEYSLTLAAATGIGLSANTLTFTGGTNAARVATVTLRALADASASDTADEAVTISIPGSSAAGTPRMTATGLDGGATGSGSAKIVIRDTSVATGGVTISEATLMVAESGSGTYTVVLNTDPGQTVTVTPASDNADVTFSPPSLSFTHGASGNWSTPKTVTVSAAADGDVTDDTATISHAVTGYGSVTAGNVVVTVDDAGLGFVVEPTSLTVVAGETATYRVRALSRPTRQLRFRASSDDTDVATVPTGRNSFAAGVWQTGSDITVTGVAVGTAIVTNANETAAAESDYNAQTIPSVTVTVKASTAPVISIAADSASVTEGTAAAFTLTSSVMAGAGGLAVTLTAAETGDFSDAALPATATIPENMTTVAISVATDNDTADEANGSLTLSVAAGSNYRRHASDNSASVTLLDNDATTVALSGSGSIAETAGEGSLTVTLGRALSAGESLAVPLSFAGGATFATDYTLAAPKKLPSGVSYQSLTTATPSITFTGGAMSSATATLRVLAESDSAEETDEAVTVALGTLNTSSGTNLGGGASGSGTASFTITDDDGSGPVISIAADSATRAEGSFGLFTVTATPAPTADLKVNLNVGKTGNLVASTELGAKEVTISANSATASYRVNTFGDSDDEPDGSVTVSVTSGTGYTVSPTNSSAKMTVTDNDPTTATLTAPAGNIDENGGAKQITVTLGRALVAGETLTAPLTFGGTAMFGTDYTLAAPSPRPTGVGYSNLASTNLTTSPPTMTFTGGAGASATATLTLTATNDSAEEVAETITVEIGVVSATGLSGGASDSGSESFSITDDDDPSLPVVSVTAGADIAESGNASFTVSVLPSTHPALTVRYTVTQAGDYFASTSLGPGKTVILAEDAGTATFSIAADDDMNDEVDGAVTVTLTAHSSYSISGTQGAASLDVSDNDGTVATISSQSGNIPETGGQKIVSVTLSRAPVSGETVTVPLTFGGTATFATDYTLSTPNTSPTGVSYANFSSTNQATDRPTITFTGGARASATATFTVVATHDINDEGALESVTVSGGSVSGTGDLAGDVTTSGTASFSITDDDGTPVISIAGGAAVTEGGTAMFTLTANPAPQSNLSVALEVTQDGTFVASANLGTGKSVTFSSGASTSSHTVATVDDSNDEVSGSVSVKVASGDGYTPSTTATEASVDVTDDDATVVTLSLSDATATESSTTATASILLSLNRALVAGERLIVPLAFAGGVLDTDFSLALSGTPTGAAFDTDAGFVTFTGAVSASATATVVFSALADADEDNDTVTVSLGTLTATGLDGGASGTRTGNGQIAITDAGPQPRVRISPLTLGATEPGTFSYFIRLHTDPGGTVRVTPVSADPSRVRIGGALSFNSSNWENEASVTHTVLVDGDIVNNDVVITHDVTGYGGVTSGPPVTVAIVDQGRGVGVSESKLSQVVGQDRTYELSLDSRPTHTVTITPSSSDAAIATVSGAVTFTPATWNMPRTVTLSAVSLGSATITHAVTSGDSGYRAITPDPVKFIVERAPAVTVSESAIRSAEYGADATYTVVLATDPRGTVRVTPATTSGKITFSPARAEFNSGNWETPIQFTVSAIPDLDLVNDTAVITHSVTGYGSITSASLINVTVTDAGAQIRTSVSSLSIDEGGSTTLDIFLTARPSTTLLLYALADGTVLNSLNGVSPVEVDFLPSSTATAFRRTLTISGQAAGSTRLTWRAGSGPLATGTAPAPFTSATPPIVDVTVNPADRVNITPRTLEILEGGSGGEYQVSLNSDPGSGNTVTVTPSSDDTGAATVAGALTFTSNNWSSAQTVTVSPVDDNDENQETVIISHAVAGYSGVSSAPTVTVTVNDDEAVPELSIAADATSITEGAAASFTVTADSAPASALTVMLSLAQTGAYVDDDDDLGANSITIASGESSAKFTVDTDDDADDEVRGSLTATLTANSAYKIASPPDNAAAIEVRDNDATSVVLGVPAGNVAEDGGSKALSVTLGRALEAGEILPVEVEFAGAATLGTDYTLAAPNPVPAGLTYATLGTTPTITFTGPSPTSASFTLTSTDDEMDEGTAESVSVSLATLNATSGTNLDGGAAGSGTGAFVITDDDDPPVPEVSITAGAGVTEGTNASFTVTAAPVPDADLVVRLNVSAEGAFVAATNLGPDSVTIAATESSATFEVATQADEVDEIAGAVTLTVTSHATYTISDTAGSGAVPIADDDPTTVTLAATDTEATEGETTATAAFTVTLGRALVTGETLTAPLSFTGGAAGTEFSLALTAATGIAFDSATSTLTFTGGAGAATVATLTLTALDDTDADDESVAVSLGTLTSTGLGGGGSGSGTATITLLDDESTTPTITVEAGAAVFEGDNALFTVRSSRVPTDALTVDLTTSQQGSYVRPGNLGAEQVTIQPGTSTATLRVFTDERNFDEEPDGFVTATVEDGNGYKVSAQNGSASVRVVDANNNTLTLRVADSTASEGDTTATAQIQVAMDRLMVAGEIVVAPLTFSGGAAGSDFTLALASQSHDDVTFDAATSTLTFTGASEFGLQSTTAVLTLTAIEDTDATDESVTVGLGTLTTTGFGATIGQRTFGSVTTRTSGSSVITITDNDEAPEGPVLSVAADGDVTEGAAAAFTITATPAPTAALTVNLGVTQDGDFVAAGDLGSDKTVIIPVGGTASYSVPTTDDEDDEADGSVTLEILAGTDYSVSDTAGSDDVAVADDDATSVTLAVTDATATEGDADATAALTVTLGRRLETGESITAVLTFAGGAAGTDFTLALAQASGIAFAASTSTLTFTGSATAASVATLTLTPSSDADVADETVTVSLGTLTPSGLGGGVSGTRTGNGEIAITDAGAVVPVLSVAADGDVTEGTAAEFTITATPAPTAALTVNLDVTQDGAFVAAGDLGGDTVTIPGGDATAGYSVPTEGDDVDEPDGSVTLEILTGADYTVSASAGSDDVAVADDDALSVELAIEDSTATEGDDTATAEITVTLGRQLVAGEGVTVVLSFAGGILGEDFTLDLATAAGVSFSAATGALTFTGAASAASVATLTLTPVADADGDNEAVTISLGTVTPSGLGGGGVDTEQPDEDDREIEIIDAGIAPAVLITGSPVSVTEAGATGSYSVSLATDPGASVTVTPTSGDISAATVSSALTFTSANWSQAQSITVTPIADADIDSETVTITHAVTGYPDVTSAPSATVSVTDRGRGVAVDPTSLTMAEGATAEYSVVLHSAPTADVTVTATSNDTDTVTVSAALTFTSANWDEPQSFTATGVGGGSASITHSVSSSDAGYLAITPSAVSVAVTAVARVALSETSVAVAERGADASYTVVLNTDPGAGASVVVTPESSDPSAATVSGPLTFTAENWSTPQTVTVSSQNDNDAVGEDVTISHTVTGYAGAPTPPDVAVSVADFGHAILVEPAEVSTFAGESASYTLTMTSAPADVVMLSFVSGSDQVATVVGALELAPADANTPVTVELTGVAEGQTTISHSAVSSDANYNAITVPAVTVTVGAAASVRITPTELSLGEGGEDGTYSVVLGTNPGAEAEVTVTPASGDSGAATVSDPLNFNASNWNVPQSVTVSPVDDDDLLDETLTITHAVTGYAGVTVAPSVAVTIVDDDRLSVVSISPAGDIFEGGNAGFRVSAAPPPPADLEVALNLSALGNFSAAGVPDSATVTILAGADFANYTLATDDDDVDEPSGSLTATLVAGDGYALAAAPADSASLAVRDNDATVVTLSAPAGDIAEADGRLELTLSLNRALAAGESLPVELALRGAAEATEDYVLIAPAQPPSGVTYASLASSAPVITFTGSAGSSATATLTLAVVSDELDEDAAESVFIAFAGLDSTSGTGLDGGATGMGSLNFSILDDDDAAMLPRFPVVSLSAGPNVVEGAEGVFTIAARPAPVDPINVALDVSATGDFIDAAMLGAGSVTLSASAPLATFSLATLDDELDEPDGSVSLMVQAGEGYLVSATDASADLQVSDDDATDVTLSAPAGDIAEDASKVITVAIGRALTAMESLSVPLTLGGDATLASDYRLEAVGSPESGITFSGLDSAPVITFSGGAGAAATASLTLTSIDDAFNEGDGESVTIMIGSLSEATLSGGADASGMVQFQLLDDDEGAPPPATSSVISISAGEAVTEGDSAVFMVSASPVPATELVVSLSVSQQGEFVAGDALGDALVTIAANAASASYEVSTDNDGSDEPNGSLSVALVAGDAYELADSGNMGTVATVQVQDDDATGVTLDVASADIAEAGGTSLLTVTLERPLIAGEALPVSLTLAGTAALGSDYALSAPDPVPAGVGYASLDSEPTITFTGGDNSAAAATLTLTAIDDSVAEGESESVSVGLGPLGAGSGTGLGGGASGSGGGTLLISDDDEAGLTVAPASLTIDEGASGSFEVSLTAEPSADVTVTVAAATDLTLDNAVLTFGAADWSVPQTVTVTAGEDDDAMDDDAATLMLAASGGGFDGASAEVAVTVTDNDEAGLTVAPASLTIAEGASGSFEVSLTAAPTADVTVTVAGAAGTDLALDSASLTFGAANWSMAQTVTVTAGEDDDAMDDAVTLMLAASGGGFDGASAEVAVAVTDNDEAELTVAPASLTIDEGASGSFEVSLTAAPTANVTVTVAGAAGTDLTLDSASLTFGATDWNMAQTVTVTAGEDDDAMDDAVTLMLAASGGGFDGASAEVAVAVTDNDDPAAADAASAWLGRFGRTVAEQVFEGVNDRLSGLRASSGMQQSSEEASDTFGSGMNFEITLAGYDGHGLFGKDREGHAFNTGGFDRFDGRIAGPEPSFASPGVAFDQAPGEYMSGGVRSGVSSGPSGNAGSAPSGMSRTDDYVDELLRNALARSSFQGGGTTAGGRHWGLWGRGAYTAFNGSSGALSVDGGVTTGQLGADVSGEFWTVGLSVSHSQGDGDYSRGGSAGDLESTMTAFIPYISLGTERFSVWGAAGAGEGEMTLMPDEGDELETDIELEMGAVGLRGRLLGSGRGFGLAVLSDAMFVNSVSEQIGNLPGADVDTSRIRLALEGSWTRQLASGGLFSTSLEGGLRQDEGDAEEGLGGEVSATLSWIQDSLTFELEGRTLLSHEDDGFDQKGVSAYLAWDPSPDSPEGPAVSLRQRWGVSTASGMQQLFEAQEMSRFGLESEQPGLDAEVSWGLPLFGERLVGVPFLRHGTGLGAGTQSLGVWISPLQETGPAFELGFEAMRAETLDKAAAYGIKIGARIEF